MSGYYTIDLSLDAKAMQGAAPRANGPVTVTVTAFGGFKGTVDITYVVDGDHLYLDPSSASVYVPQNGSATTSVTVGLAIGQSVVLHADAIGATASIVLSA